MLDACQALGVLTGRSAGGLVPLTAYFDANHNGTNDLFYLRTVTLAGESGQASNTVQDVKDAIDDAISWGCQLIIVYGHIVSDATASPAPFGSLAINTTDYYEILDHIKLRKDQGLIDNKLMSEWYNSL